MRKVANLLVIAVLLTIVVVSSAGAAGTPSSKVTAVVKDITVLNGATAPTDWKPIMTKQLKTANQKDLFVDVSLECGLYTMTRITYSGKSEAAAGVNVRVVIDPGTPQEVMALPDIPTTDTDPGGVTFCRRIQTLSGLLGEALSCEGQAGQPAGTCTVLGDAWIELALDTMDANSFNFIAPNVSQGVHTIQVQARIDPLTAEVTDVTKAKATLGWGSVAVEEVRMAKSDEALDMTVQ